MFRYNGVLYAFRFLCMYCRKVLSVFSFFSFLGRVEKGVGIFLSTALSQEHRENKEGMINIL